MHAEDYCDFFFQGGSSDGLEHCLAVVEGAITDGLCLSTLLEFGQIGRSQALRSSEGVHLDLFAFGLEVFLLKDAHLRGRVHPAQQREMGKEGLKKFLFVAAEIIAFYEGESK